MNEIFTLDFVVGSVAQEVVGSLFAFVLLWGAYVLSKKHRFDGWTVEILNRNGQHVLSRKVGMQKAEAIFDDESDMSVYLKGLCSPYGWLAIDLVTDGPKKGALEIDRSAKQIRIDLSKPGVLAPPQS